MKSELNISRLYQEQGPFVARTIRRLVGEGSHVDDLLQETFIVAYKKREQFDPERASVTTWLYGIAANLCRHHERSQRRTWWFKKRLSASGVARTTSQTTPGSLLERKQAIQLVHDVLGRLPMKQREAFVLFELEGLSGREISELLHVREGTVWTRIHHARKKFLRYAKDPRKNKFPDFGRRGAHSARRDDEGLAAPIHGGATPPKGMDRRSEMGGCFSEGPKKRIRTDE